MKSILDPTFRYTPSANTDLRKTFARIRRANRSPNKVEQAQQQVQRQVDAASGYPRRSAGEQA